MTGTERKRLWRLRNPERSRAAERERAQARRWGHWGTFEDGATALPCVSSDSYWRYENSTDRFRQRLFYSRYGAGAHRLSPEEFRAAAQAVMAQRVAELEAEFGEAVVREVLAKLGDSQPAVNSPPVKAAVTSPV
jgi:hypothetical protein